MADFYQAFPFIAKNEGGYSNDSSDYGDETFMGISRKYYPLWEGWAIIDDIKENYPPSSRHFKDELENKNIYQKVTEFHKKNYWDALKLDQIKSQRVATKILDMSINLGVPRTGSILQTCANIMSFNELKVDNIVGLSTINLINELTKEDNGEFLLILLTLQQGYIYMKLCQLNSSQEKFIRGWINRLHITIGEF